MTITHEEKQALYKEWKKKRDLEEIQEDRGKYTSRTYMTAALSFIFQFIIVRGFALVWAIGVVAAIVAAAIYAIWGIVYACQVL